VVVTSPKAVGRSRNRGCKGHRILRRVLVGGRHLRLSRAIFLHGKVVTAALAASSRGRGDTARKSQSYEGDAKALRVLRKRERRQRCQRLDRLAGTVGRKRPRSEPPHRRHPARGFEARQRVSAAIRRSVLECRETLGTLVINRTEPKTPWGVHAMKVAEEPRTHEVRVHVDRLGGRSWSDASCVLSSGRSQGLVESQGASQKEARSTT